MAKLNIYLGFFVPWSDHGRGAYCYAISPGGRDVQFIEPQTVDDATPVKLALAAISDAILSSPKLFGGSPLESVDIKIYTGSKDAQVLWALREVFKRVKAKTKGDVGTSYYRSKHADLMRHLEKSVLAAFQGVSDIKFEVRGGQKLKSTKKAFSYARTHIHGQQPIKDKAVKDREPDVTLQDRIQAAWGVRHK